MTSVRGLSLRGPRAGRCGGGQRRGRPAAGPGGPRPGTPPARGHAGPSVSRLPRADLPPRPGARAPPPRAPKQVARAAPTPTPARGEAAHRPSQADRCDPAENPEPPPPRAAAAADELTLRAPALPRLSDAGGRGGGATRSAPGAGRHYPQCLSAQRACAVASRLHRAAGDPRRWLRAALARTPPLRDSRSLLGFRRRGEVVRQVKST